MCAKKSLRMLESGETGTFLGLMLLSSNLRRHRAKRNSVDSGIPPTAASTFVPQQSLNHVHVCVVGLSAMRVKNPIRHNSGAEM